MVNELKCKVCLHLNGAVDLDNPPEWTVMASPAITVEDGNAVCEKHRQPLTPSPPPLEVHHHVSLSDWPIGDFVTAPFSEQMASLHAVEGWEPEQIEQALGTIYWLRERMVAAVLASTKHFLERAYLIWLRDYKQPSLRSV